ncbi:MAG: alginate export family protein [Verrucomicrobia bacterium]|nr:alginate export family protein [Verrucomicrobiota bacterium]
MHAAAMAWLLCGLVHGEEPSPAVATVASPATAPNSTNTAGLLNDWLRQQWSAASAWNVGGQTRLRYENKEDFAAPGWSHAPANGGGAVDFRQVGGDPNNSYLLYRQRLHLGYTPATWLTAYAEARESAAVNDDRRPSPDVDTFDLQQGYVVLGDPQAFPLTAKVGRQEMIYGDERLIGNADWNNVPRTFDAAKLRYETQNFWVDAFASRVVLPLDGHFNLPNDYDWFSGLYASTRTLVPRQETQFYVLSRNVGLGSPNTIGPGLPAYATGASPRDIYTVGFRIQSLPDQFGPWDYSAEMAGQFGHYKETTPGAPASVAGKNLAQEAMAAYAQIGYTWKEAFASPRVGLEYDYASGDSNPTDAKHQTFDNLFPTNHKFYGYMDFFSWQNIHDLRFMTSIKPLHQLTVTGDYHSFWLANTHDSFYTVAGLRRGGLGPTPAGGYGINPNYGSYVGSELDLVATYAVKSYASAQLGFGHFFVGDYVKSSLAGLGGATDANWVYVQMLFNF